MRDLEKPAQDAKTLKGLEIYKHKAHEELAPQCQRLEILGLHLHLMTDP